MIAAVIPTCNRRERLLRTLGALPEEVLPIVVLDGCTDGSYEAVGEACPRAERCVFGGNLWWSASINRGLRRALELGCHRFCLFNDDVLPGPAMFARLGACLDAHPGSLVGPRILFADRPWRVWCSGGGVSWLGRGVTMRCNGSLLASLGESLERVDWLPGMGTLFDRAALDRVGFLDERAFPQYFSDTDFSLRASRRGVPVLVCPPAHLLNDLDSTGTLLEPGGLSLAQARELFTSLRSHSHLGTRLRFLGRHCPPPLIPWQVVRYYGPLLAVVLKKLVLRG